MISEDNLIEDDAPLQETSFWRTLSFPTAKRVALTTLFVLATLFVFLVITFGADQAFSTLSSFLLDTSFNLSSAVLIGLGVISGISGSIFTVSVFRQRTAEGGLTSVMGDTPELGPHVERKLQYTSLISASIFLLAGFLLVLGL